MNEEDLKIMNSNTLNLRKHMHETLSEFSHVLDTWKQSDQDFSLLDPFEIHYGEGYSPANAAVIYASVYESGMQPEALNSCKQMIERSITLFQNKNVMPFCRVFLVHYSLMAIAMLPEKERAEASIQYKQAYSEYMDDCGQVNTNCSALQWGSEVFLEMLGMRQADTGYADHLISRIEQAQNQQGFINDEIDHEGLVLDGMPIAYHLFTNFILISILENCNTWSPDLSSIKSRTRDVILKGIDWLQRTLTSDGNMAMVERSSYQTFTWGSLVAIMSYADMEVSHMDKAYRHWLQFKQEDGSFSCTPNYLPHSMRVGFENYTHVTMYNALGFSGIAVAERILRTNKSECLLDNKFQPLQVTDEESGYAFFRARTHSFGAVLRVHNRKYTPSMQGFHYRLHGKEIPLPEVRMPVKKDSKSPDYVMEGVWEGYLLRDDKGQLFYPSSPNNINIKWIEQGVRMIYEDDHVYCEKTIECLNEGFRWRYKLKSKQGEVACYHIMPLLVHDGRDAAKVSLVTNQSFKIVFKGQSYLISCKQASNVIGPALERSSLSGSGISAQVRIQIPHTSDKTTFEWETDILSI